MEVEDIRIFMAVAEYGSVSLAADKLGYVQPNVTARIRSLERKIGHPLFHRHRRGMTLNVEGRKLLTYGEQMMRLMDEIHKAFQDERNLVGSLCIGLVETVVGFPEIISSYHNKYKNVDISLESGVSTQLIEKVLKFQLDGAFVAEPVNVSMLDQIPAFDEEIVLVCSANANENGKKQIQSARELLHLPFILFNEGCQYRERLQQWLKEEQIVSPKIMEFATLETIMGTVVSGLGVTLIARSLAERYEREGLVQLFSIPEPYRNLRIVYVRRSDSYLGVTEREFIKIISEVREGKNQRTN
ncbi:MULTISPECIES: LysR family transcriptional regulator [Priestia]|uniref:LysR family transcriptional regulator n=1 Tax=Priestia TaxID=2800373 RepID=UPI00040D599F|nr:LysR family transcriptional regulator [Priestia aryabhattai]MBK0006130.1 LysR family transcriptional regulator [Bacillus sp. S35]MCM3254998.1 LysR family transcriptional regulator [Priestia aryabhattai]